MACVGHADLDQHMAGRGEAADLPAVHGHLVGQAVAAQRHLPERRRGNVVHEAAGDHLDPGALAARLGLAGGLVDLGLADGAGVHIGLVRQVHEVVDHQPVVGLDVEHAVLRAVEGDALAADAPAQRLVLDLVGRGGHVPGVLGKCAHGGLLVVVAAVLDAAVRKAVRSAARS
jgi:hypothetical protein